MAGAGVGGVDLSLISLASDNTEVAARAKTYHHSHAILTMIALATIEPNRIGVIHFNAEGAGRLADANGEETRVDAVRGGFAGLVEGALDDGVVARVEVEFDGGADGGAEDVGLEDEAAGGGADGDALRGGGRGGRGDEGWG